MDTDDTRVRDGSSLDDGWPLAGLEASEARYLAESGDPEDGAAAWESGAGLLPWEREALDSEREVGSWRVGGVDASWIDDGEWSRHAQPQQSTRASGLPPPETEAEVVHVAEALARQASSSDSEAEVQSLVGALTLHLLTPAPFAIRCLAPALIGRNARLVRSLRGNPARRRVLRGLPRAVRRTRDVLVRRHRNGAPVSPALARRVHGRVVGRMLGGAARSAPRASGRPAGRSGPRTGGSPRRARFGPTSP